MIPGSGGRDCDDGDPTVYPCAFEACDGFDGNCDGVADLDQDEDGWRDCDDEWLGDCDDDDWGIHPAATEFFDDGVDSDCDGEEDS